MPDTPSPDDRTPPQRPGPPHSPKEDWLLVAPHLEKILDAARPYRGAIEACAEEAGSREQRKRLRKIADDLGSNQPAEVVFDYGRSLDPSRIEALQWDTASRHATATNQRSARFSKPKTRAARTDKVIWNAFAYPAFTLLALLLLALVMWNTFIPEFAEMFYEFELPLPAPTELILSMQPFIIAATCICIAIIAIWTFRRLLFSKELRSWLSFRVPIFGSVYRNAAYGKFCHLTSILLQSGAPLSPSLRIASRGTLPDNFAKSVDCLVASTPLGPQPLPPPTRFPHRLVLALQSNLSDHQKAALLRELSSDLYARASSRATHYLQPIIVFAAGAFIGFVVVSLFMPMVSLVTNLSG